MKESKTDMFYVYTRYDHDRVLDGFVLDGFRLDVFVLDGYTENI